MICTLMEAAKGMPYWLAALAKAASADFSYWNIAFVLDQPSLLKSRTGDSAPNSLVLCTMSEAYTAPMLSFLSGTPGQKSIVHPCYRLGATLSPASKSEAYSAPMLSLWVPPPLRRAGSEIYSAPTPSLWVQPSLQRARSELSSAPTPLSWVQPHLRRTRSELSSASFPSLKMQLRPTS
jgi:hypothetical protein